MVCIYACLPAASQSFVGWLYEWMTDFFAFFAGSTYLVNHVEQTRFLKSFRAHPHFSNTLYQQQQYHSLCLKLDIMMMEISKENFKSLQSVYLRSHRQPNNNSPFDIVFMYLCVCVCVWFYLLNKSITINKKAKCCSHFGFGFLEIHSKQGNRTHSQKTNFCHSHIINGS